MALELLVDASRAVGVDAGVAPLVSCWPRCEVCSICFDASTGGR